MSEGVIQRRSLGSGLMAFTGAPEGQPMRAGVRLSDLAAGLWAVIDALGGLVYRARHEQGGQLDMWMLDASPSMVPHTASGAMTQGTEPERMRKRHPGVAPHGSFHAADAHLVVADPDLAARPTRVARRLAMYRCFPEVLVSGMARGRGAPARQAHDVPRSPVLGVNEALRADYTVPRQLWVLLPHYGDVTCAVGALAVRGIAFPSAP